VRVTREQAEQLGMTESTRRAAELGVVYQIYPRSFRDTDGDGVGDLPGITAGVEHLDRLGVEAVWLSPIHPSPMADFGYDVSDYTDVHPLFGTLDDLDRLVARLRERDIGLLLDWVPNHTSDQHPWFLASRSSRDDPKRDWYVWRDPGPGGGPPNNWTRHFADEPAWTFDRRTGQYYLHLFLPEQPDLDWSNPAVRAAMGDVLRFWLDRGVTGFRADVIHLIGKDAALRDDPPERVGTARAGFHDEEITHTYLREIRSVLDEYGAPMVGEVNLPDATRVVRYVGDDRLPMAFYFGLLYAPWGAGTWREVLRTAYAAFDGANAWPVWALGNHDTPRQVTRYGSVARARAAAVVLLTLRGTPFLYAGDELGLADAEVEEDRVVDPGGRDGCRAPIPWDGTPTHGWPVADPWLPWPPEADDRNLALQERDPDSTLHLYRRLIAERRASPALALGELELLDTGDDVLAYRRWLDGDERRIYVNFADEPRDVTARGSVLGGMVVVGTDRSAEGAPFSGRLGPAEAVVVAP
jgi:alpha-glucosidase